MSPVIINELSVTQAVVMCIASGIFGFATTKRKKIFLWFFWVFIHTGAWKTSCENFIFNRFAWFCALVWHLHPWPDGQADNSWYPICPDHYLLHSFSFTHRGSGPYRAWTHETLWRARYNLCSFPSKARQSRFQSVLQYSPWEKNHWRSHPLQTGIERSWFFVLEPVFKCFC